MKSRLLPLLLLPLILSILTGNASAAFRLIPLTLRPGVYESEDGSVLDIGEDGSCTYATEVSGKINSMPMRERLTFHGATDGMSFSFTQVTWHGLDLTELAAAAGFDDASHWEQEAYELYAAG